MFCDLIERDVPQSIITDRRVSKHQVQHHVLSCKDLVEARNHWNKEKMVLLSDYSLEPGLMKEIALKEKLVILVPVSVLMRTQGLPRTLLIRNLRSFLTHCLKARLECRIVSFAQKEDELRSERELIHIGCLLGLTVSQAKKMVGIPERFIS